jgi:hypothetical protein
LFSLDLSGGYIKSVVWNPFILIIRNFTANLAKMLGDVTNVKGKQTWLCRVAAHPTLTTLQTVFVDYPNVKKENYGTGVTRPSLTRDTDYDG